MIQPDSKVRLRVLISAYACEPGKGSEPEVGWQVALHMAEHHDVTVVTRANNRRNIEQGLAAHNGPSPTFIYYDPPRPVRWLKRRLGVMFYYLLWQAGVRLHLSSRLREFDLIHHVTFNSFLLPGFWWFTGRPIVLGPLGGGQVCPWRQLPWFGRFAAGEALRSLAVANSFLLPNIVMSMGFADRILVANADTSNRIPRPFRHRSEVLLETAIHPGQIVESRPTRTWNETRFLWIGRMEKRKAGALALNALAQIQRRCAAPLRLTMVGTGPEEKGLRMLCHRLQVEDLVEFTSAVPKDKISKLMLEHDVLLFPSLRDTSGNVVLEAMAAGLPVISFKHQGVAEMTSEETAIRVSLGSFKDSLSRFGSAMKAVAESLEQREKLGAEGRERVRKLYTWPVFAQRMSTIYRQTVERRQPL